MKPGGRERHVPWLGLGIAALSWLLSSAPASLQSQCALTHEAWAHGEVWRLWTGHLVHFGAAHLRGDLLAFAVWAALLEQGHRRVLALIVLGGAPLLALAILGIHPQLAEYRGLSGLDCSLVVALLGARGLASERGRSLGVACLALFLAKCAYELVVGRAILAPDLGDGVKLLPLAHVLGAVVGWAAYRAQVRGHRAADRRFLGDHAVGAELADVTGLAHVASARDDA